MRNRTTALVLFFIFIASFAFSFPHECRWGGKGYDPAKKQQSSRFSARNHHDDNALFEIWVDSKETVHEVERMDLITGTRGGISSDYCFKAEKHITAAWSCVFHKKNIQDINGKGAIQVFNRTNQLLTAGNIDFDKINQFFDSKEIQISSAGRLIIPDKIGLYFLPSPKGNKLPALVLTVFAGNGCDQAGALQITKKIKLNQPNIYTKGGIVDILEVQIKGYEFQEAPQKPDIDCPAALVESRSTIELKAFMTNQELQLRIVLNDEINTFDVKQYEDVVYLNPIESSRIISWNPGQNMPDRSQGLGFMTEAFRERLAHVRLNGSYTHKSDLAIRLRDYFRNAGYEPLDEKLQGYPRMNPLEEFIVFVPYGKEIPEDFKIIGKVPYHEMPGGDKTIDVGLAKKKAANPFFVRY